MKLLELHILQSFPVSCLNRDDAGLPKTAVFGGVTRARLSSQCLKRAVREEAQRINGKLFQGKRTKRIAGELRAALRKKKTDVPEERISLAVQGALAAFGKPDNDEGVKALYFLAPKETDAVAEALAKMLDAHDKEWSAYETALENLKGLGESAKEADKKKAKKKADDAGNKLKKIAGKSAGDALKELSKSGSYLKDAVDIALFGRMAADSPDLNIDGAAYFSHALSTHEAEPQQDFYSALDDILREKLAAHEEGAHAGSGMLGVLEFTSATYYRYLALDLDSLFDEKTGTLRDLDEAQREEALQAFIEAALKAIPRARKTGMNAHTLPSYALGIVRNQGGPVQLVNAFEQPVKPGDEGFVNRSVNGLVNHFNEIFDVWDLAPEATIATGTAHPEVDKAPEHTSFGEFRKKLVVSATKLLKAGSAS